MAIFEKVKLSLRISTNALDSEIADNISAAKEELIRAGVDPVVVDSESALVTRAIATYCHMAMASDIESAEGYQRSFEVQEDQLRKATFEV